MAHTITPVDGDLKSLLYETFTGPFCRGYIKVDGVILPEHHKKFTDAFENFEVRNDDIWVCTFLRSGTTWTQEMVWCIANNLDYEGAKVPLIERFPYLEASLVIDPSEFQRANPDFVLPAELINSVDYVKEFPSPRLIKTHFPFHLLPRQLRTGEKSPKMISVIRNPKDVCISYYHYRVLIGEYHGNFEDFCKLFLGDKLPFSPYWVHVLGYWEKRNSDNLLLLKYEDMKKDLPSVIRKTAKFLGKNLTSDQVSSLNEHLSFASMKMNPSVDLMVDKLRLYETPQPKRGGSFVRCGEIEQWKTHMEPDMINRFDDWARENLQGTQLSF